MNRISDTDFLALLTGATPGQIRAATVLLGVNADLERAKEILEAVKRQIEQDADAMDRSTQRARVRAEKIKTILDQDQGQP